MLDEKTKEDIIKAANNYNTLFPNTEISYPEMLKRFNNSQHAMPENYLAPIYDGESYRKFISFAKEEIEKESINLKGWEPSKEHAQNQNIFRRNQIKSKSMFSIEK